MKVIFFLTSLALCSLSHVYAQQNVKITSSGTGYLEYLPQEYKNNGNRYPLLISLHGIGEKGTSSTDPAKIRASVPTVAKVGVAKLIKNGAHFPFIVISPQLKSSFKAWPGHYVMDVINYVKKNLRVDESRIYLTGLSLGGFGVWTTLGAYPKVFAAAVPVCSGGTALTKACAIAAEKVPIWAFHGSKDGVVSYNVTLRMVNAVNNCNPKPNPMAKTTIFPGLGHSIWDKVYKETDALSWMLKFRNGAAPENHAAPVVKLGGDKTITLPTEQVTITSNASAADGKIASYLWNQVSGPSTAVMASKTAKSTTVSKLVEGTYIFRVTVTDSNGNKDADDIKITVRSKANSNSYPAVNAGADKTLQWPAHSVSLAGSATDKDGKIVSYRWTKISGGSVTLNGATTAKARAHNLAKGSYVFRLSVKDNKGAIRHDDVRIIVKGGSNVMPVAKAGPDRKFWLPQKSISISGSGMDRDGNIISYNWTKLRGPAAKLTSSKSKTLKLTNLKEGYYYLMLTVRDDRGAKATDKMWIRVYPDR
jgi:predicted esterase